MWTNFRSDHGFLASRSSLEQPLPKELDEHLETIRRLQQLARQVPQQTKSKELPTIARKVLNLPLLVPTFTRTDSKNTFHIESEAQLEDAFALFCMLASYFKLCMKNDVPDLPDNVYTPLLALSAKIDRHPVFDYTGCVLNNWYNVNGKDEMILENIGIRRSFTGLEAEEWFYKVHVVIEYHGGVGLKALCDMKSNPEQVMDALTVVEDSIHRMKDTFSRLREYCTEMEYSAVVRPWLGGFTDRNTKFGGASGAESSLLPVYDLFFGVPYLNTDSNFVEHIRRFRNHMPTTHRNYLNSFPDTNLRDLITLLDQANSSDVKPIKRAYNRCINAMLQFRRMHLGFASSYITAQAKKSGDTKQIEAAKKGTGGTEFAKHFMEHIQSTRECLYNLVAR